MFFNKLKKLKEKNKLLEESVAHFKHEYMAVIRGTDEYEDILESRISTAVSYIKNSKTLSKKKLLEILNKEPLPDGNGTYYIVELNEGKDIFDLADAVSDVGYIWTSKYDDLINYIDRLEDAELDS